MIIITIRTDKPEAEIGLYNGQDKLGYEIWLAHRELSRTLHKKIETLLAIHGCTLQNVQGIVCFKGPGSFTGLRVGLTVGNAFAYGLEVPVVAAGGDDWIQQGISRLLAGEDDHITLPDYGRPARITAQKK